MCTNMINILQSGDLCGLKCTFCSQNKLLFVKKGNMYIYIYILFLTFYILLIFAF